MQTLTVLDVGHGNSAVLTHNHQAIMIDVGLRDTVHEFLREQAIKEILAVLISHADEDHVGGLTSLLYSPNISIRSLFINADQMRETKVWNDLRYAVEAARLRCGLRVYGLTVQDSFSLGNAHLKVLSPPPEWVTWARDGRGRLSSNSMSAVIRVTCSENAAVLLPGDMDHRSLKRMTKEGCTLQAPVLVFPHHGGKGSTSRKNGSSRFVKDLCAAVRPELVVFSNGRARPGFPRPEVVRLVKEHGGVYIACTELAKRCHAAAHAESQDYLGREVAFGAATRSCCAGTIVFDLEAQPRPRMIWPNLERHRAFVTTLRSPMCN